jgi:hypothetical protein
MIRTARIVSILDHRSQKVCSQLLVRSVGSYRGSLPDDSTTNSLLSKGLEREIVSDSRIRNLEVVQQNISAGAV